MMGFPSLRALDIGLILRHGLLYICGGRHENETIPIVDRFGGILCI
jgi:hypothetical protein